ncbi:MAG: sugar phosphate nucleotidyltransferase [Dehalococcoidales bacterium]|nr:sugar phosphate nucleotidyltransferase [Dehalococcoidales bacterium]
MKAVILAAGEGKRMHPLTCTRPKVMLPIANKPILEHLITEAEKAGIKEFIFIVGYHDEQIRNYFGNGSRWGVKIDYSTQRKQLGTADALRMVEGAVDGNFLMINGDAVIGYQDIEKLAAGENITMSLTQVENTGDLGLVEINKDKVVRIYEKVGKAPSNLANAGLYLFTPEIFAAVSQTLKSPRGEYEITDSLQLLIDRGHHVSYQKINYWLDFSYPWDLLVANESLLSGTESQNLGEIEENVVTRGAVSIGKGSIVRSGSYIIGPVIIGEDCEVGPNCYIRPHTAIGDGCRIGGAVEVKNSIIMKNTDIPHHNYVGDSIIGEDCNLGAGTKIANLRLDERQITVAGKNTGRRKLGAIMGDGVKTGINACINVGSMIGHKTFIGPGAVVSGVISPESIIL